MAKYAPMAMDENGQMVVCCEACGSLNLDFDGWDIDKCLDCGHWRYRGSPAAFWSGATHQTEAGGGSNR